MRWSVLLLVAMGCAEARGTVVDKKHEDASFHVMFLPMTTCSGGKSPICTTMIIPYNVYDDEDWILRLKDEEGVTRSAYVSQEMFNSVQMGEFLDCATESFCENHDQHKKLGRKQ